MDTATLLNRVAHAQQAGSHQRAIQLCNLGLNRNPTPELERTLWLARAAAHAQNAQWALAEFDCRRALERAEDGQARVLLARSLLRQRRYGEALQELERELARDGRRAESWQLLSKSLSGQLRHREAADAAGKAWGLDPTT